MVNAGTTITYIIPTNNKWVIANYKETQIENLYVGQKVRMTVPRAYTHCHLKTARLPFRHTRRQSTNLHPAVQSHNVRRVALVADMHCS